MVFPPGTLSCSSQNPINLSHPHVAIFFSPVFVFVFVFFIVYIQVLTARLSEQILVFVLLENNNNKTTKTKK